MPVDRRGPRSFWAIAASVLAVFVYVVASGSIGGATTVPAPYGCNGATETVAGNTGTPGDDIIFGTPGPETLEGLGGNDLLCGLGGGDALYGGPGNDRLEGHAGPDRLYGGVGNDHLVPTAGDTVVNGNGGSDCTPSGSGESIEYPCPQASTTSTTVCIPPPGMTPVCE
jgi:Ca2+-binding RTX toxin-like protein